MTDNLDPDDEAFKRAIELRKLSLSREKFWVGSVALVVVTTTLNWQIQWREVELKQIEEENKHLSQFVENILDRDPYTRLYVAEYFENLSYSNGARLRWESYRGIADKRVQDEREAQRRKLELEVRLNEILEEIGNAETTEQRRIALRKELLEAQVDIESTRRKLLALNPGLRTPPQGSVIGDDERVAVVDTSIFPYNALCAVKFSGGSGGWATGFLVSPRVVVTISYMAELAEPKAENRRVSVACGRNGDRLPFGESKLESILPAPDEFKDDQGLLPVALVLRAPVHYAAGLLKVKSLTDAELYSAELVLAGYPWDHPGQQIQSTGKVVSLTEQRVIYDIDSFAGMGGAPLLVKDDNGWAAVGVHEGGAPKGAVRITETLLQVIQGWIASAEPVGSGQLNPEESGSTPAQ